MKYPSPGKCIYCGRVGTPDEELTDEHVFPLSLKGNIILENSSCVRCAGITSDFEGKCTHRMFLAARVHLGLRGRRKKRWPSELPIHSSSNVAGSEEGIEENTEEKMVPVREHPCFLMLPRFDPAGILVGRNPEPTFPFRGMWMGGVTRDVLDRYRRSGARKVSQEFSPDVLARTLAKIGHSYAYARLDTKKFRPLLPETILGDDPNVSYLVGGGLETCLSEEKATIRGTVMEIGLHQVHTRRCVSARGEVFLIAEVRLFAHLNSPIYHVVVGEITSLQ